jgi:hypothetical protein
VIVRAKRLLAVPMILAAACTLAYPLDEFRGKAPAPISVDAGPDGGGACGTLVPTRPVSDDGPDGPELVFALREIEIGNDLTRLNFDRRNLDGLCSCPQQGACTPPPNEQPFCDQSFGVDNAGGALLDDVYKLSSSTKTLTEGFKNGSSTIAVRVRGYNGKPDDPRVELMIVPVVGLAGDPAWDGGDVRQPNEHWLANKVPLVSKIFDSNAYVRGGVLVASASGPLPFGDLIMETIDFRLLGKLEADRLTDGNLLFRSQASEFVRSISRLPNPNLRDSGLCSGPIFDTLKARVCKSRDLPADPKTDGQETPCTALSFTYRFSALKVSLGATKLEPPVLRDCGPTLATECNP